MEMQHAAALAAHAQRLETIPVKALFADDPDRFVQFSCEQDGLLLDFSRQRLDDAALRSLLELARAAELPQRIADLLNGAIVNNTEGRAALHTLLRAPQGEPLRDASGTDLRAEVRTGREKLARYVQAVRAGELTGATGERFTDIINIGIGGSDLGPAMAVDALRHHHTGHLRCHFVSNIDGSQLADLTRALDAARTLVIVCSKTFTTLETLSNARLARGWIAEKLGEQAVPKHFAAVSTNAKAMNEFGVGADARFTMWDWVGGRYSMWSAIGIAVELAIGTPGFEAFLAGARSMDEHFRNAPLQNNLPVLLGLIGVWNRNFLGCGSHAVLPYDQRLARFPAYLQQLEMESLGKRVTRDGQPVEHATGPVIWGEPGSNAQHSFFQLLHQGTGGVSMDFLLPVQGSSAYAQQQDLAIANCLAQVQAFMAGYSEEEASADLTARGQPATLASHKVHPGSRPATVMLFQQLDPHTLGQLVALYEHKVYVQSVIWGINPFDQWGVELGKKLCEGLIPAVRDQARAGEAPAEIRALLERVHAWK